MKTEKGKKKIIDLKGDMRVVKRLLQLYDACLKNATALLAEADLLFTNGHHARAFALAHTGWEETGKSQIVADFLNRKNPGDVDENNHFTSLGNCARGRMWISCC